MNHLSIDWARSDPALGSDAPRTKTGRARTLPVPEELALWIEARVSREQRLEGGPADGSFSPLVLQRPSTRTWSCEITDPVGHPAMIMAGDNREDLDDRRSARDQA